MAGGIGGKPPSWPRSARKGRNWNSLGSFPLPFQFQVSRVSPAEHSPGSRDIRGDLLSERGQGTELFLLAQFRDEGQLEFEAVEVLIKVQKVGLDSELGLSVSQGWSKADVQDGGNGDAGNPGADGINSNGRPNQAGGINIGSGKAELTAESVTLHNGPSQGVGAAEHAGAVARSPAATTSRIRVLLTGDPSKETAGRP